jgi:phosphotransferase system  glucose/maltose/N-acetylglucosamine-specific IIC component
MRLAGGDGDCSQSCFPSANASNQTLSLRVRDHCRVSALKDANLAVKFVLELLALAAFAYWGATLDGVVVAVIVGIAAPASVAVLWGLFAAPRASRRLPTRARVPFELSVFTLATAALVAVGWTPIAIAFAAVVGLNAVLLGRLDQWDR